MLHSFYLGIQSVPLLLISVHQVSHLWGPACSKHIRRMLPSGLVPEGHGWHPSSPLVWWLSLQSLWVIQHQRDTTLCNPNAAEICLFFVILSGLIFKVARSSSFSWYTGVWCGGGEKTPGAKTWNLHLTEISSFVPILLSVKGCSTDLGWESGILSK